MQSPQKLNESGLTLVELMVSVALFGISAMTMATLIATVSQRSVEARNEAMLSERLYEFANTMEIFVTNTTRVLKCGCGNGCVFDEAASPDCSTAAGGVCTVGASTATPIFEIETEDSQAPYRPAMGNCYAGAPNPRPRTAIAGGTAGLIPRGCKRRIQLQLIQPTRVAGNTVGTMGELRVVDPDLPASNQIISSLGGVFSFRCGQVPVDPVNSIRPANRQFHYEIRVKARKWNTNSVSSAADTTLLESWYPDPAEPNFNVGIQRDTSNTVAFRNLNVYGVHFGKTESSIDCVPDGQALDGRRTCCSGFWSTTGGGTCRPMTECLSRGTAPPGGGPEAALICCSHRIAGGACL